jgi:transposase
MAERIIETIGCDLGDKWSEVSILLPRGELQRPEPVKTTRKAMTAFFTRPRAHVVIEVGTHSRWVSELLLQLGHKVTVANPRKVKLISQSNLKRDRKDAEILARLGRADEELLSPVQHRGSEAQADLAVAKARDAVVRVRTKLVNHARGLVKSFGERLPACTAASFHRKAKVPASQSLLRRPSRAPAGGQLALAGTGHGGDLRALLAHQEREELVTLWTNSWIEFWQTTGLHHRYVRRTA